MSETSTPLHAYGVDDDVGAQSQSCSSRGSLQSNATGSLLASSEGVGGQEPRQVAGRGQRRRVQHHALQELLEASGAPIPACAGGAPIVEREVAGVHSSTPTFSDLARTNGPPLKAGSSAMARSSAETPPDRIESFRSPMLTYRPRALVGLASSIGLKRLALTRNGTLTAATNNNPRRLV